MKKCFLFTLAFCAILTIISYKIMDIGKSRIISSAIGGQSVNSSDHQQNNDAWKQNLSQAQKPMVLIEQKPMVLSLQYWEQTGNALRNLIDLQCWANSVRITKIVEPSISPGSEVFYFHGEQDHPNLRFQDLFDIGHWNQMSLLLNHSILASRNDFFRYASKKVIHVQIRYASYQSPFKCKSLAHLEKQNWFKLLKSNGFQISTVCIEVLEPIAADVFENKIYGSTHASVRNVTIIFESWRGFTTDKKTGRLSLTGLKCGQRTYLSCDLKSTRPKIRYPHLFLSPNSPLVPSKRVLLYRDAFVSQYMHGTQYVAVMLRSEILPPSIISSSPFCMKEGLSDHKKALDYINGTKTLLFTDYGKYGSRSLWNRNAAKKFSLYMQEKLDLELSIEQLDSAFEDITKSKDSVLMASLVSVVVARATCVVMIGGGTFQAVTLNTYAHSHKGHECYFFRDSGCSSMYLNC